MRITSTSLAALVAAILFAGCGKPAATTAPLNTGVPVTATSSAPGSAESSKGSGNGGVAVIDLDKIQKRLGRDTEIAMLLDQKKQLIESKLNEFMNSKRKEFSDKQVLVGDKPNDDQKKELNLVAARLQTEVNQALQTGQNVFSQEQAMLLDQFRNDVKPVAIEIAKARGLSTIITASTVWVADNAIDITDAVIEKMPPAKIRAPEPVKSEPAKSDTKAPAKADPFKTDPFKADPSKAEPAKAPVDKAKSEKPAEKK